MDQKVPVMDRLRGETRDQHTHVEALPCFRTLVARELPIASYVGLLQALAIVYAVFEQELTQVQHPRLVAVWDGSLRKLPLLQQDLAALQPHGQPETPAADLQAILLAQRIRQRAYNDPVSLLGYLYVLEGSTLGGMVVQAQVARAFRLRHSTGLAYLSSYGKATKAHWRTFSQRMNTALVDMAEQHRVVAASNEAFTGIAQLLDALYPLDTSSPRDRVRMINPAAGSHEIPHDPRELQAAFRAGERSWHQFPYYAWRYGERGEQFTRSDSAWLVTLAAYDQDVVEQQIRWLGRILSARGMPQWMLELHVDILHTELVAAVPENQAAYARLARAAHTLREMRRRYISDAVLTTLNDAFDTSVGSEWSTRLPQTGGLLAAAVADEHAGITRAVTSIEGWMTDPSRFPLAWIEAVHTAIRTARTYARSP